jgi:RNA polymerase sigma-70 factor (ECF subfamily)
MRNGGLACGVTALAVPPRDASTDGDRTRTLLDAHFVFIWRLLRRLGISENDVDDAVQRVFIVASAKLDSIAASSERSFLFGTALRVASSFRRAARRRCEVGDEELVTRPAGTPSADESLARRQEVAILDRIISSMPDELRDVFVLCEIEELSVPEAATLQAIPVGTAASRLRRARKEFQDQAKRVFLGMKLRGGGP